MELSMSAIRAKTEAELQKLLAESQTELRSLRVKASAKDLKDVRSIRRYRQFVARLLSRLGEFKQKLVA
ncbi:MAG: 50S ribosomal protein L29 [Candidatus Kerfeldbacteria bacterium]|nr:50S ribosomal protein L29 [Candidatus Kerfeldbacteria bacterium]